MKRLLLSGYYGYGNAGDEAVLAGLAAGFRAARSAADLEMVALSGSPSETRAAHGIAAADRYRPAALLAEIRRADLVLSGGGSLLQDVTSAHGIFYYLGVVRLAQMLGKKTMFIAQGVGPLKLARSRRLVKSVANRLNAVTVRDPDSARLLREAGVTRPSIEVTADPALLLEVPEGPHPRPLPHQNGRGESERNGPHLSALSDSPLPLAGEGPGVAAAFGPGAAASSAGPGAGSGVFGVALRPWGGREGVAAHVADACASVLSGRRALLLPMQPESDKPVAEQFARQWHQGSQAGNRVTLCSTEKGLMPLLANIAACDLMIGMRLHALILAAAAGVPSVALSYDPKVDAFMQGSGQGDAVYDLGQSDPDVLQSLLRRVWAERAERGVLLRATLPSLRARAARNVDVALALL